MGKSSSWRFDRNSQLAKVLLGAAPIVLLALLVYLPVAHFGYIWDDDVNITKNAALRSLFGLRQIWTNPLASQQYYPLTYTSFWIEYHLWGLKPLGYHLDNVLIHALSAVLLWLILRRLAVPGAWLAAAIYAVHPLQAESVAWITERKNTLSALFYFSAMLAYLRYAGIGGTRKNASPWIYILAFGLFACALLSKTSASTLPVALFILLWWKHGRLTGRRVLELVPLVVISAGVGRVTVWLEKHHLGAVGQDWNIPFAGKLIIAGKAIAFYVGKLFLPVGLIHIYPKWQIHTGDYLQYIYPLMAVAVPAILWLLRKRIGMSPLIAVLFFEVTLAPGLGFVSAYFTKYSFVQDRVQYVACAGLIALTAGVIMALIGKIRGLNVALPAVIVLILAVLTWRHIAIYESETTLWTDTLAKNPAAYIGYINLGVAEYREGRCEEAIEHYKKCLAMRSDSCEAYVNLGVAYTAVGEVDRAIECFSQTIKLSPNNQTAHFCLAELLARRGRYEEAVAHYVMALKQNPNIAFIHTNLAMTLLKMGKSQEAIDHFTAALRLDPGSEEARGGLELAKQQQAPKSEARDHYIRGIELEGKRDLEGAVAEYQKAVRINPEFAEAHFGLGMAYDEQGLPDKAIREYQAAVRLKPDTVGAHNNLAIAYYTQGDGASAWKEVKLCRKYGFEPNPDFLAALSQVMPEP